MKILLINFIIQLLQDFRIENEHGICILLNLDILLIIANAISEAQQYCV